MATWEGTTSRRRRLQTRFEFVYLAENLMGELGADVEVIGEPEEMSFGVEQNLELFERPLGGIRAPSTEALAGSENGYHDEWR